MKLRKIYQEVIKKGIEADPRPREVLDSYLHTQKKSFDLLNSRDKEFFDQDKLFNPFSDTRILFGDQDLEIRSLIAGIDIDGSELLLVDRLREKGTDIDLVVSHHPQGKAYAHFYEVMDLQTDVFYDTGISLSSAQNLLQERKGEVSRRVSGANHQRALDFASWLKQPFMCMHTPCDNLAYSFIRELTAKEQPKTLGSLLDLLMNIPEYRDAAAHNNPPRITVGGKDSRISKIHIEFTGGTEGPLPIYEKLSAQGVDTIVAMHQSEQHHKKCKEANINVIVASHIASDNLGVNCMLDHLLAQEQLTVYECSGFKRFSHK